MLEEEIPVIRSNTVAKQPPEAVEERFSWFPIGSAEDLAPEVRALFAKVTERVGFVPNVFRTWAWRPERLLKWRAHYDDLMRGSDTLSAAEREMIAVTVSMVNGCLYCLTSHSATLRVRLGDPVLGDRITFDYRRAGLDERQTAMLDYAVKITKTPVECDEADIRRLLGVGFTIEDVWDIAEITAMFNLTNRVASATGMIPNREYNAMGR
jgi:uncharacterized peroxidase-related enzyme